MKNRSGAVAGSLVAALIGVMLGVASFRLEAVGQQPPPAAVAPALTETQTLRLQNALQALEITRLRAEQAARDFEAARTAASALVTALEVPGYTLDLQRMAYVPVAQTEPPMP